jgi:hypothetical protein
MRLFRAMIEDADGKPKVGPAATMLGVRAGVKVPPNDVVAVSLFDIVGPGFGMSVAPNDPAYLPIFRRPPELNGGTGKNPIWSISVDQLGSDLRFHFDKPPNHGLIEPAFDMKLSEFQTLLEKTRDVWVRYI